jgi:hypothetical protein
MNIRLLPTTSFILIFIYSIFRWHGCSLDVHALQGPVSQVVDAYGLRTAARVAAGRGRSTRRPSIHSTICFDDPATLPRRRFPTQDLSHLTAEQIRAILDTVTTAGFDEAIRSMIGTLYCDPMRPHNMNVIMEEKTCSASEPRVVTKVYGMDRRAPTRWEEFDTVEALRIMLEEHADAIRNFPDDLELEGGERVPRAVVDAVDDGYDAGAFKDSQRLHDALKAKMTTSLRRIRELLKPYSDLLADA